MSQAVLEESEAAAAPGREPRALRSRLRRSTSLFANGEPMVWAMGASLGLTLLMIVGLLGLIFYQGLTTFWPRPVVLLERSEGAPLMGEVVESEDYAPGPELLASLGEEQRRRVAAELAANDGVAVRREVRTGNFDLTGTHFQWVSDFELVGESLPAWALVVERQAWGRFYGTPTAMRVDGEPIATEPGEVWDAYLRLHGEARERFHQRKRLEKVDLGRVNHRIEGARLAVRSAELDDGEGSPAWLEAREELAETEAAAEEELTRIRGEIAALEQENDRYELVLSTADGTEKPLALADVVRAYPANSLSFLDKAGVYLSRWREFLLDEPREANSEGGVLPALFGTVTMTLLMSLVVVPFGVLAALYLREYARQGLVISAVRIAVNNLAGVPSIVFGVFGLGFFCYIIGGGIDQLFYEAKLPSPTYGSGGLFWASLTLALLTLPVVIVATEEAIAAVPSSMREGSYACGATKWQTIRRIVLPKAAPGIMTGMILAIARGAGEVAPLMLVGAVKLAPELPVDGYWPFVHPERSFMHLGFHIYDLGFQSQNSEAARPMVYTTTLLLISIIVALNLLAVWARTRLRNRVQGVAI